MVGNDVDVLVGPLGEQILDGVRHADVKTAPVRMELLKRDDFLDQRMVERVG